MIAAAKRVEAEPEDATRDKPQPMLSEAQVLEIVPVARTTLYRMVKTGKFPKGVYVSPNRRLWLASEIANWQRAVDEFDPCRGRGKGRRHPASD